MWLCKKKIVNIFAPFSLDQHFLHDGHFSGVTLQMRFWWHFLWVISMNGKAIENIFVEKQQIKGFFFSFYVHLILLAHIDVSHLKTSFQQRWKH